MMIISLAIGYVLLALGAALLWGTPGVILATGFVILLLTGVCIIEDWLAQIARALNRLAKRWAPQ